jgi:hypothetical protein
MLTFLLVNLPIPLSSPILPLHIKILLTNDAKVEKIKNWESEKKGEFISNINIEDINELALLLNNLFEQDSGLVDNSSVNDMVKLSVQVGARYG